MKIVVVNTHPFTDPVLMDPGNEFRWVSTMGPYPGNRRKYGMLPIVSEEEFQNAIRNTVFLSGSHARLPLTALRYARLLIRFRPDLVYTNIAERTLTAVSWVFCRVFRRRFIVYNEFWRYPRLHLYRLIEELAAFLLRRADQVDCIGTAHMEYLRSKRVARIRRIPCIYHPVGPPRTLLPVRAETGRPARLLYVGRIVEYKGLRVLLEAATRLNPRVQFRLTIVGSQFSRNQYPGKNTDYENDCVRFAGQTLTPGQYEFLGFRDDIPALMKAHDLLIMPNTFVWDQRVPCEAWGIVAGEALMNDLPVIATTAVASAFDLIQNGKNGWQVEAGSARALADAIERSLVSGGI